ncbi:MAG: fibrillarin-like rRNA/tRNA 2'-O-methyltransferase [Candidatus Aenigmarchaeota archaeon]|nr:fibrillarin-like rRNA/tRNA 2'-O-methyltransferase [Candidatus Aenigmarchaeota archaeon]
MKEIFPGVFSINNRLATENPFSGYKPFDGELLKKGKKEFRMWNPTRSKAGAAIKKGIKEFPIKKDSKILYLGAAHGYTPSFLSNIIGKKGVIYAVEFSERCFNELLILCLKYKNIVPILADARKPELYYWIEKVDVVYVDIAQPDETEIAVRNCKEFLKPNSYLMMAIKSRSIDVTKSPKEIYKNEIKKLKNSGFKIIDWKTLDPLEKAHAFIVAKL